ncbi:MAG: CAP domain-containing protein [Myxococcota bacterium]
MRRFTGTPCRRTVVVWPFAILLASACATSSVDRMPAAAAPDSLEVIDPYGPSERVYGGGTTRSMNRFRETLSRKLSVPADGRLDSVATDLALISDYVDSPPPGALDFLMQHYGLAQPATMSITMTSAEPDPVSLASVVAEAVKGTFVRRGTQAYGAAAHAIPGGWTVVVVMHESGVELEPILREVSANAVVDVRGRLPEGFVNPALYRTDPDGVVDEPVVVAQGQSFHGAVVCRRGRNQIELTGEGEHGVTVLANFPVYCGVRAPIAMRVDDEHSDDEDETDVAQTLFDMVNRERAKAGLPRLAWSSDAADVTTGHSEDMADSGFVGHISPSTGGPDERTRRAKRSLRPKTP